MWGCPASVLEAELQDGKKIPQWNPRAQLGVFVGFLEVHSSLVTLMLNTKTGKISPQYHVVFDDKFSTVNSLLSNESLNEQWYRIFKLDRQFYLDFEYDEKGCFKTSHFPTLDSSESAVKVSEGDSNGNTASEGDVSKPVRRSPRLTGEQPENDGLHVNNSRLWGQTPASVAGSKSVPSGYHEECKVRKAFFAELPILAFRLP